MVMGNASLVRLRTRTLEWSHAVSAHACFVSAEGWESTVLAGINTWSEKGTVPIQTYTPNGG